MPAITPPSGGTNTAALIGRILLPFGIAYFFSFLYRTVNAVAGSEIAASLDLTPGDLGLVTSAYFLTFALFQIPLGILLDRYGPRIVEAALLVVAAGGALVFAMADSITALAIGRGLIGLGVSACLMAALKANVQWFPAARLPLANGIIIAMGGLGAIAATTPVQIALTVTDWRMIFTALAVMTVAVAVLLFAVGPRHAKAGQSESWGAAIRGAARIFRSPVFLRIAPLVVLSQATFLAYHGLWAAIWMRDVAGVPAAMARRFSEKNHERTDHLRVHSGNRGPDRRPAAPARRACSAHGTRLFPRLHRGAGRSSFGLPGPRSPCVRASAFFRFYCASLAGGILAACSIVGGFTQLRRISSLSPPGC